MVIVLLQLQVGQTVLLEFALLPHPVLTLIQDVKPFHRFVLLMDQLVFNSLERVKLNQMLYNVRDHQLVNQQVFVTITQHVPVIQTNQCVF